MCHFNCTSHVTMCLRGRSTEKESGFVILGVIHGIGISSFEGLRVGCDRHHWDRRRSKILELIHELILLVIHLKYYDGLNCDLIKYKDLLVIIMGSDNKIK